MGIVAAVLVAAALLAIVAYAIGAPIAMFFYAAYLYVRYTRKGLCVNCHKPAAPARVNVRHADQMFNTRDQIIETVCACGQVSRSGNRRFAEW